MTKSWVDGPMLGFDTETTGVSTERDHILTASFVRYEPGLPLMSETVWINPGVSIPVGASQIHGIYDKDIKEKGEEPAGCLEAIVLILAAALVENPIPIVGMNLSYDMTILDRNCRRHGVVPLGERLEPRPMIDVMILDKLVDRFRKGTGSRKLQAICPLYRAVPGPAHSSEGDALSAMRVAWRIGKLYPKLGRLSLAELHRGQELWKQAQDKSLAAWLKGQKKDASDVDGQWPVRYPEVAGDYDQETAMLWEA